VPDFAEEIAVRSSFIRAIALGAADSYGEIYVRMARGATYVYRVAAPATWENFKNALSKGKFYNRVIKRRYDYVRKY
jgi:hypothetical protein